MTITTKKTIDTDALIDAVFNMLTDYLIDEEGIYLENVKRADREELIETISTGLMEKARYMDD